MLLLLAAAALTVAVERERPFTLQKLGGPGRAGRALVLYHPSRDARFSDDLSLALAEGFKDAGFAVDRATLTSDTPTQPEGYALVGLVSNTYWWTPDLPTLRYLRRARFDGLPVVGLMGGLGATDRSERILGERLLETAPLAVRTRSYWLLRPNDETRLAESNRAVAQDLARRFGKESAEALARTAR